MKRQLKFLLFAFLPFFLSGCIIENPVPPPSACITTQYRDYFVGETINFNNCSLYGDSYRWDFGDGFQSNEMNPEHYYTEPGEYIVSLTVYGVSGQNTAQKIININTATTLAVQVMYETNQQAVTNCYVKIYETLADYIAGTNVVASGYTNTTGHVEFYNLNSIVYYIQAFKNDSNTGGFFSNHELGYYTEPLNIGITNGYNIYLRYYPSK